MVVAPPAQLRYYLSALFADRLGRSPYVTFHVDGFAPPLAGPFRPTFGLSHSYLLSQAFGLRLIGPHTEIRGKGQRKPPCYTVSLSIWTSLDV